jgi:hypothetical protein
MIWILALSLHFYTGLNYLQKFQYEDQKVEVNILRSLMLALEGIKIEKDSSSFACHIVLCT